MKNNTFTPKVCSECGGRGITYIPFWFIMLPQNCKKCGGDKS